MITTMKIDFGLTNALFIFWYFILLNAVKGFCLADRPTRSINCWLVKQLPKHSVQLLTNHFTSVFFAESSL
jgi:hypothetical protein